MNRRNVFVHCLAGLLLAAGLCVAPAAAQNKTQRAAARAARAGNINAFVQRLMEVEPERREELLANNRRFQRLPAAQRRAIENRLRAFDKLPAERRELLIQRYQLFNSLHPNQQTQARQLFREWNTLPRPRRAAIAQAVRRLRRAQPEERAGMIASERFTTEFDETDRQLIASLVELAPEDR